MATTTHSVLVLGTLTYASPLGEAPLSLASGIEGVTDFSPITRTLSPDETGVTVTPPAAANGFMLKTNRPMRYRLNGGVEFIRCDRLSVIIGTSITSIELYNDQQTTPRQLEVDLVFITGATLT